MLAVPTGSVMLWDSRKELRRVEQIDAFRLGRTQVTVAQYQRAMVHPDDPTKSTLR